MITPATQPPLQLDAPPPVRNLFATKTAFAQYIVAVAGVLAVFWPDAQKFVADHSAAILLIIPIINLAVRRVTHGRVALIANDTLGM